MKRASPKISRVGQGARLTLESIPTDERVLAYTAGLFDGEGCIVTTDLQAKNKYKKHVRWGCRIGMTHEPTIRWLIATWGGKLYTEKPGPPRKPKYVWDVHGHLNCAALLSAIRPFLITKAHRADLALSQLRPYVDVLIRLTQVNTTGRL